MLKFVKEWFCNLLNTDLSLTNLNKMNQYKVRIYPNTKSPRLFNNKFLELLTRTHPLIITSMYLVLGVLMIWLFVNLRPETNPWKVFSIVVTGYFSWTLAEYMMHRFLYHKASDGTYNSRFKYMFHGVHHEYPNDSERLVLPPLPSLLIAAAFLGFFYLLMGDWAYVFGTGFLWGYLSYMNVHFIIHKFPAPKRFNFWWRHHAIHHFQQHDRAYGVTTSLWDYVFRTMPEEKRKTVEIEVLMQKHHHEH
jgi:sterol desaturase/sphingolipid hydroxylase (fatty acid hydroxylase superfamily)